MDGLWFGIVDALTWSAARLDAVFGLLHVLGPTVTVLVIAVVTVLIQKLLTRLYRPQRYRELRVRYHELRALRDEAMKWDDREKASRLARNIDQAELNQAYYNYFFEGLMVKLLTRYLPFVAMLAYVNESYRGEKLLELFGRSYLFEIGLPSGDPLRFGAVMWLTFCVLLIHIIWFFLARRIPAAQDEPDR